MKNIVNTNTERNRDKLKAVQDPLMDCLVKTHELLQDFREKLQNNPGVEIFSMLKTIQSLDESVNKTLAIPIPKIARARFTRAEIDSESLDRMVGELILEEEKSIHINEMDYIDRALVVSKMQVFNNDIHRIVPSGFDQAWVLGRKAMKRMDIRGQFLQTIRFEIQSYDICLLHKGGMIMSVPNEKRIALMSLSNESNHSVTTYIETEGLQPNGIATSSSLSGSVWVSLVDDFDFNRKSGSKRLIRLYSAEKEAILDVHLDAKGKELFKLPGKIAISDAKLHVATINSLTADSGDVVVTDASGVFVTRFSKLPHSIPLFAKQICPVDLSFNVLGDLVISDKLSKSVLVLDNTYIGMKGTYKCSEGPLIACFTNGYCNMWLGTSKGNVSVVKCFKTKDEELFDSEPQQAAIVL